MQQAPPPQRKVVRSLLRASGSTAVLVLICYLLPLDHTAHWAALMILGLGARVILGAVTRGRQRRQPSAAGSS